MTQVTSKSSAFRLAGVDGFILRDFCLVFDFSNSIFVPFYDAQPTACQAHRASCISDFSPCGFVYFTMAFHLITFCLKMKI